MSQDNKLIQLQLLRNIYGRTTPSKIELENAKVYIHKKDKESGSQNIHIDVEHDDLTNVIEPGKTVLSVEKTEEYS